MSAVESRDREIVIRRTLDTPPEAVWRAWTDPQQVAQWWGPLGFTTTVLHRTPEARDGQIDSGMEAGAAETFDRLAELPAELQSGKRA